MELTRTDRLILSNQYKVLSVLDADNADHYSKLQQIVENGYAVFYSMLDEDISEEMPESESRLVLDVLDFYLVVSNFLIQNPNDKDILDHARAEFRGFDGNHESEYLGFVNFLIRIEGKYQEQSSKMNFNSHTRMVDYYRRLVSKWQGYDSSFDLTKSQILDVLNA